MSTTIDSKVVEMRFDNSHFEKHTRETMSTLDKLKQKLNFKDSSKGLENINSAANKVDMRGMSNALDTVNMKFSALQVVGVTALANITNSAVNAGKRIVSALTIDPVRTGLSEYETQINAVQTILANTQKEGADITKVNAALDELNKYADKTIYNFTEMTRNIGTFTAAGVDLDTSVTAIQGIANLAAVSGSNAQQASTAMYQLSQALSSGTVKLMDWNSVVNAGMGGQVFQDALKETARVHGIAIDEMIADQGSFRETLSEGWLTSEILTETLQKFTLTTEGLTEAEIEANREMLRAKGYTEAQIDEIFKLGETATDAATKVKTFTQLWDVLKEAAQSGWSQTWRIIIGDFEEAKALFTPLANFLTGAINGMSDFRNGILELALGSPFAKMAKTFNTVTEPVKETIDTIRMSVEELEKMANQVIRGNWGNGKSRLDALTEAGYNYYAIQNKVNEKLDNGFRYSEDVIESQYRLLGATEKTTEAEKSSIKTKEDLIINLAKMSKAELEAAGYTEDQIEALSELRRYAKMTGLSIEDLVKNIDDFSGRWLIINSLKNIGKSIVSVFTAIKDAWRETFFGKDADNNTIISKLANGLFKLIAAFHKFTTYLTVSERGAENLKDTFKGLFSILDLVLTIIGGPIKIALSILGQLFKALDISLGGVLEFTGGIGRAISAFHDWIESIFDFTAVFEFLAPYIKLATKAVKEWFKNLKQSKIVTALIEKLRGLKESFKDITKSDVIDFFKKLGKAIKNLFNKINDHFGGVPGDIISGLVNGLKGGAGKVIESIKTLANNLITKFKEILGIESPSKVFFAIGGFVIAGLIGGLLSGNTDIGETVGGIATKIAEFFQGVDWGTIFSKLFTGGMSVGLLLVAKNLSDTIKNFSSLAGGLGSMFDGVGEVASSVADNMKRITKAFSYTVKSFGKVLKGIAFKKTAEGIKELAWSILIIAGAIVLLTLVDTKKMWHAVGALAVMTIVLGALAAGVALINKQLESGLSFEKGKGLQIKGFKSTLIQIAVAILAMAIVLKTIGKMDPEQYEQGLEGLSRIILLLASLLIVFGLVAQGDVAANMDKAADMFKKLGIALVLMAITIKLIGGMDYNKLVQGGNAIFHFAVVIAGLMAATKLIGGSKNVDKIGDAILKIAGALVLMALVAKILGGMDADELKQGRNAILAFSGIIVGLMAATKLITGSKNVDKIGGTIFKIAGALVLMVIVAKIAASMSATDLLKGTLAIAAFAGIIVGLMAATKLITGSKNVGKIGLTLLAMAGAIAIIAATALVLSLIDVAGLAKGVIAVGLFGVIIALMLKATKDAKDVKGSLIAMAVAIGIMAASIAILSFIDPKKLIAPTLAMAALMGMFALIAMSTKNVTSSFGALIVMTVAIGVLATALILLARLPVENVIGSAVGLSILMLAMSGVFFIISKMGSLSAKALLGIAGIAALCLVLYIVVDVLRKMQDVQNAAQNATVLGAFMGVLAVVLLLTAAVGAIYTATAGIAMLGLAGMLAVILMLYLVVDVLEKMQDVKNAMSNMEVLQKFLITMTAILVVLAIVGPLALIGVTAMYALTALMVVIGALAIGIAALMQEFPALKTFLDQGLPVLIQLAGGIGQMIGAFVGGIFTQIASTLPGIGLCLSQFMINALPFIMGAKLITADILTGVGALAAAILVLTAADLISGITSFMSGGASFAELGTELSEFMTNALPFIATSYLINPKLMEGVKTLAEAILILTGGELIQSITSWLTGGASLSDFGDQLPGLAKDLNSFVTNLGTFTDAQVTTVDCAGRAIKALAEAASEIPNDGGLWGAICGENSLATFGYALPGLGTNMAAFITNLGTFTEDQVTTVDCVGRAIKALAEAANEIPNDGGLWGAICGDNGLASFGYALPGLGTNMAAFLKNLGTFSDDQVTTVDCAGKAIKALAEAAKGIPNEGGLWAAIVGDNSLATFGENLPALGTNIKNFVKNLGTFSDDQVSTVNSACEAIKTISGLGKIDVADLSDNLDTFGSNIVSFAKDLKTFVSTIAKSSSDKIDEAVEKTNKLIELAQTVADTEIESLKTFGESLKSIAKDGVKGFVKEFNGDSPKKKAKDAGKDLADSVKSGIKDKKKTIKDQATKVAEAAVDKFCTKSLKSDAKTAGEDLAKGFANGIKSDKSLTNVKNAGTEIGKAALKAAKKAIDSNSPSKEAMKIGNYFGQGLVIGINDYQTKSYDAGYGVAEYAKNGLSKAISKVTNLFNSDIDMQPTIRPVLDLSDVESGANHLNTLFNNSSIGVNSNLNAISSGMSNKIQNGTNSDVVSAINKLRKDLGNVSGNTYNINGVAYADTDTDINNAVQTLIRAANVERRI